MVALTILLEGDIHCTCCSLQNRSLQPRGHWQRKMEIMKLQGKHLFITVDDTTVALVDGYIIAYKQRVLKLNTHLLK